MNRSWANYHTHCDYCDGVGSPESIVETAIRKGMKAIGFSSHATLPFPAEWTMKASNLQNYCSEINQLKMRYEDQIDVLLGLEIDYIPGLTGPDHALFENLGLDYAIGSVHFCGKLSNGYYWTIDSSRSFKTGFSEIYNSDVKRLIHEYYRRIREMTKVSNYEIIGHLDIAKVNNRAFSTFRILPRNGSIA